MVWLRKSGSILPASRRAAMKSPKKTTAAAIPNPMSNFFNMATVVSTSPAILRLRRNIAGDGSLAYGFLAQVICRFCG